jgi:hypothetical protein
METNGRYMMENNFRYSRVLLEWAQRHRVPFLYASSAAVYGASREFREERVLESPLNVYGYSKFLFDQVVRRLLGEHDGVGIAQPSAAVVGFRYFNVYGPREQHKGRMASVAFHHFNQYMAEGRVRMTVRDLLAKLTVKPDVRIFKDQADLKAREPALYRQAVAARLRLAPAEPPAVLSGCDAEGRPLAGAHGHAHVLPLDLDEDDHIDHLLVWAPLGLDLLDQRALRLTRGTYSKGGV